VEILFSTPDAIRYPAQKSPEALAFIATAESLQLCDCELDFLSLRMIANGNLDAAQTIYLNELANF